MEHCDAAYRPLVAVLFALLVGAAILVTTALILTVNG
jgi:hypothetical protein